MSAELKNEAEIHRSSSRLNRASWNGKIFGYEYEFGYFAGWISGLVVERMENWDITNGIIIDANASCNGSDSHSRVSALF